MLKLMIGELWLLYCLSFVKNLDFTGLIRYRGLVNWIYFVSFKCRVCMEDYLDTIPNRTHSVLLEDGDK